MTSASFKAGPPLSEHPILGGVISKEFQGDIIMESQQGSQMLMGYSWVTVEALEVRERGFHLRNRFRLANYSPLSSSVAKHK
jgi:hypothetical protein